MYIRLSLFLVLLSISMAFSDPENITGIAAGETRKLYSKCGLEGCLSYEVFEKSLEGIQKYHPSKPVIGICDFTRPSSDKRFFLIDLNAGKILAHTLVAHGKNSGELMAVQFSNTPESLQSSKGFYLVGEAIESPKHGPALLLEGLEKGINDNARRREIIIHGADYVSESFVKEHGRLGRSFGCPALPVSEMKNIIPLLSDGGMLYIHAR